MKRMMSFLLPALLAAIVVGEERGENLALGKPYTLSPRPNYSYCTDPGDRTQLTDGQYSKGYFWTQKPTVGWANANTPTVTIDLGSVQPIRGVSFNTAAGAAGVEWPLGITILVSDDGKNFYPAGELIALGEKHGAPPKGYSIHRYWTDMLRTHGRFVSLLILPGGPYTFVDEIEVYKGQPEWVKLLFSGEGVTDANAYRLHLAFERRLRHDLSAVRDAAAATRTKVAATLDDIEREMPAMPRRHEKDERITLPLNELHARILQAQAAVWRAQGIAPLTIWQCSPLDPLSLTEPPPRRAQASVSVAMMQNEYRAGVFNISNAGERTLTLRLRINGLPAGAKPAVHEVAWTDTKSGQPVAAALPEAKRDGDDFIITAPSGMTRQVWLAFHPTDVKAGSYNGNVLLCGDGVKRSLPLTLRVAPLRFPDQPTLHLGGWDYTDHDSNYEITKENRDAVIAHLREHFVDSPWASGSVLPANRDTTKFDLWLSRWPGARQYCVFAAVGESFQGSAMGTPAFDEKVGEWIKFWAAHAQQRGLKPKQLIVLLVDEPAEAKRDDIILPWAKAIHAANAGVTIWEDPTHHNPNAANQAMMTACDVLCPNRPMFLLGGETFRSYYTARRAAGTELAFYSCSGPARLLDPYAYHRLQAWTCWQMGAKSSFFWAFGDSGGGSSWNEYGMSRAASYTPLFLDATSVTAGKHMEAIRESVEDYEYLVMLRDKVSQAEQRGLKGKAIERAKVLLADAADRVLNAPSVNDLYWHQAKDRTVADAVRLEILETLVALQDPLGSKRQ